MTINLVLTAVPTSLNFSMKQEIFHSGCSRKFVGTVTLIFAQKLELGQTILKTLHQQNLETSKPCLEVFFLPSKNPVPVSRFPHIPISSDKSPCLKQTYGVHFQSFCLEFLETLAPFRSESLLSGTLTSGIRISRPKTGHSSSASCTRGIEETQDGEGYF